MEASAGLVAGSHNRNELVVIHGHEEPKQLKSLNGQVCEICGDEVGITAEGDLFVACNECGFPVCRPCYEYERREGSQQCPQCKTRYKRLKGSPRVEGDEDEEDVDDLEHEFNIEDEQNKQKHLTEAMLYGKMSYGRGPDVDESTQYPPVIAGVRSRPVSGEFPVGHAYGEMLSSAPHKRIHPYPASEPGSTRWDDKGGWKERMDDWKLKQQGNLGPDPDDVVDPDMPLYVLFCPNLQHLGVLWTGKGSGSILFGWTNGSSYRITKAGLVDPNPRLFALHSEMESKSLGIRIGMIYSLPPVWFGSYRITGIEINISIN